MAIVFLLGPSLWKSPASGVVPNGPMDVRKRIAQSWKRDGHTVILMEEAHDIKGEGFIGKFDRLLHDHVTTVVMYWPPLAKMQTTYDELILLCDRQEYLKRKAIRFWLVHHVSVASIQENELKILETGERSRYLTDVAKLGPYMIAWKDQDDLNDKIQQLSQEL
ncbi:MAG: hypothetical protein IPN90_07930 [Elusimicrobia bacterium]|nr:hypothetical protein [Elusimicrobiota bacterium]